jgi:tetratricopeptide (TPR) repeat protein
MAERFLYIPSIGFAALLAMLLGRRKKAAMLALAVSIVVTYSILTMARNEDWKDPVFLAKSIIRVSPQNEWGYMCLGGAYLGDDRYAEAEKAFKKAIALAGDYSSPKTGLGVCYLNLGKYEEAIKLFKESLSLDLRDVDTISSLGVCYGKLKRYGEAIKQFKDAIAVNPTFVAAYLNLGATYEAMSDLKEASEVYKTALQKIKSPQDIALIHVRIGDVYLKTNKFTEAGEEYRKAVSICGGKFPELEKIALSRFDNITRSEKKQISGSTK